MKVIDSLKTISEHLDILKNSINTFMELNKDEVDNTELLTVENWFQAIKLRNLGNVKVFIKHNFDINTKDINGFTALIWVSMNGYTDIVQLLLEAGADIDITYKDGHTALYWALIKSHTDIIKLLEDANNLIESKKAIEDDNTELLTVENWFLAVKEGNIDAVNVFINHKFDINVKDNRDDKNGNTAIIVAIKNNKFSIVKLLIETGADMNIKNSYGHTALIPALVDGYADIFRYLIEAGADVNTRTKRNSTALIVASKYGMIEAVQLLLDTNTDINAKNEDNCTALMEAIRNGWLDTIKLLINAGADIMIVDSNGNTATSLASNYGMFDTVKLLKDTKAKLVKTDNDDILERIKRIK